MKEKKSDPRNTARFGASVPPLQLPFTEPPAIVDPVSDPPVPNRAWTEMRLGKDIDALTEEEKRDLYLGRDAIF